MSFKGLLEKADINADIKIYTRKVTLADDATFDLPACKLGLLAVGDDASAEFGEVMVGYDGTIKKGAASTNFVITDTDSKLCVIDGGAFAQIKNTLGSEKTFSVFFIYVT